MVAKKKMKRNKEIFYRQNKMISWGERKWKNKSSEFDTYTGVLLDHKVRSQMIKVLAKVALDYSCREVFVVNAWTGGRTWAGT